MPRAISETFQRGLPSDIFSCVLGNRCFQIQHQAVSPGKGMGIQ